MKKIAILIAFLFFQSLSSSGFDSANFKTEWDERMYSNCMKIGNFPTAAEYAIPGSEAQKKAQKKAGEMVKTVNPGISQTMTTSMDEEILKKIKGMPKDTVKKLIGNPGYEGSYYIKFGPNETVYFDEKGKVNRVAGFTNRSNFPKLITPAQVKIAQLQAQKEQEKNDAIKRQENEEKSKLEIERMAKDEKKRKDSLRNEREALNWLVSRLSGKKSELEEIRKANKEVSETLYEVLSRYNSGVNLFQGLEILGNAQVKLDKLSRDFEGFSPMNDHYRTLLRFLAIPISMQQQKIKADPIRNYELDIFFEKIMKDNQWFSPENQVKSASLFGQSLIDKMSAKDDGGVPFFLTLVTTMVTNELDFIRGMLKKE